VQWPRQVHCIEQPAQSAGRDEITQAANRESRNVGNTRGQKITSIVGAVQDPTGTVAASLTTRDSKA
jgi:hypothetical protein